MYPLDVDKSKIDTNLLILTRDDFLSQCTKVNMRCRTNTNKARKQKRKQTYGKVRVVFLQQLMSRLSERAESEVCSCRASTPSPVWAHAVNTIDRYLSLQFLPSPSEHNFGYYTFLVCFGCYKKWHLCLLLEINKNETIKLRKIPSSKA